MTELTRHQVAETLNISPKSLARLVKDPRCPLRQGRKRGRKMVWPEQEVEATLSWKRTLANKSKKAPETPNKAADAPCASAASPAALRRRGAPLASEKPRQEPTLASRSAEFKIPAEPVAAASVKVRPLDAALTPKTFQKLAALSMRMAMDPRSYDPRTIMPLMMMGPMNPLWWVVATMPRRSS